MELESVDETLLRKIFSAHSKTPIETLYLESGNIPIRFILMSRRLNFLKYMLNEDEDSLLRSFLEAQLDTPVKGDWVTMVTEDMKELEISLTMEQIEAMNKEVFKEMIKTKVQKEAFKYLTKLKDSHSKARKIRYEKLEMQRYLKPETENLTIAEKKFIFAARTRMLDLAGNFKSGLVCSKCRKCQIEEETQEHLLECVELSDYGLVAECPEYDDLFGAKPTSIGKILMEKFQILKTPCAPC